MPKIRFSVVSFAPPGAALAVLGSTESLGKWDVQRAKKLEARLGQTRLQSEPDFHWAELDVPELGSGQVEYKFVELGGQVKWEDLGAHKNRVLKADSGETDPDSGALLLPVERFAEPGGSESDHTARFYQGVKERQEISVRKVLSQLFVGSCPRHRNHIDYLHSLGITAVFNFQTEEDCRRNCVAGIGMEEDPMAVSKLYEAKGMQYVWMPTFDMSTDGRAQMLPQASFLFAQVLRRGHTIYSHCNAGVGRSVAAACGFLTFALGLSLRQMQYVMASSRPVAFFDFEALHRARPHYDALFGAEGSDGDGDGAAVEAKLKEEALALL